MTATRDVPIGAGAGEPMVLVSGLRKSFGAAIALAGLDLRVGRGEILGLLGPNGAGKTTTINVLATLLRPDAGRAEVAGWDVATHPAKVRESIALTGQYAAVDGELTGSENLVLFGRLLGLPKSGARARAGELLERFELVAAAGARVRTYSGGMRRKLDLAASLMVEPKVLFLDEPTTGLDPRSRLALWGLVRELRERGITIVLTTQYLEEADALADRVVVVDHGRVIAEGTPADLKDQVGGAYCQVAPADPGQLGQAAAVLQQRQPSVDADAGRLTFPAPAGPADLAAAVRLLDGAGIELADVTLRRPSLDEVFLSLTGRPAEVADAAAEAAPVPEPA